MMSHSILRILFTAVVGLSAFPLAAQPEKPGKSIRHARFLAVGEIPPFRQEIRDGVRYELEPPPGSIPPREVIPGFGGEPGKAMPLRLGIISDPVIVPGGEGTLDLRSVGADAEAAPWLRVKRPESGDFLVVLFRNPSKGTWLDAANIILPEGAADTVRILNLFPQPARIVFAGETHTVDPGKPLVHRVKPGTDAPFQILVADSTGRPKRYYSGNVTQNEGERGLVLIYRADGESPRRPVKVSMLREPVTPRQPVVTGADFTEKP
jgi:hypothetical protein